MFLKETIKLIYKQITQPAGVLQLLRHVSSFKPSYQLVWKTDLIKKKWSAPTTLLAQC